MTLDLPKSAVSRDASFAPLGRSVTLPHIDGSRSVTQPLQLPAGAACRSSGLNGNAAPPHAAGNLNQAIPPSEARSFDQAANVPLRLARADVALSPNSIQ